MTAVARAVASITVVVDRHPARIDVHRPDAVLQDALRPVLPLIGALADIDRLDRRLDRLAAIGPALPGLSLGRRRARDRAGRHLVGAMAEFDPGLVDAEGRIAHLDHRRRDAELAVDRLGGVMVLGEALAVHPGEEGMYDEPGQLHR